MRISRILTSNKCFFQLVYIQNGSQIFFKSCKIFKKRHFKGLLMILFNKFHYRESLRRSQDPVYDPEELCEALRYSSVYGRERGALRTV
jgi:hypothetical protein